MSTVEDLQFRELIYIFSKAGLLLGLGEMDTCTEQLDHFRAECGGVLRTPYECCMEKYL